MELLKYTEDKIQELRNKINNNPETNNYIENSEWDEVANIIRHLIRLEAQEHTRRYDKAIHLTNDIKPKPIAEVFKQIELDQSNTSKNESGEK